MNDQERISQFHAAADDCARDIHAKIKLHLGAGAIDPVSLEKALALAFERGAVWMQARVEEILCRGTPSANRRPL